MILQKRLQIIITMGFFLQKGYPHQGRLRTPFPHPEKTYFVASEKLTDNVIHSFAPHPDTHMPTCTRTNTCTGWATQLGWKSSSPHEKKSNENSAPETLSLVRKRMPPRDPFSVEHLTHMCASVCVCFTDSRLHTISNGSKENNLWWSCTSEYKYKWRPYWLLRGVGQIELSEVPYSSFGVRVKIRLLRLTWWRVLCVE